MYTQTSFYEYDENSNTHHAKKKSFINVFYVGIHILIFGEQKNSIEGFFFELFNLSKKKKGRHFQAKNVFVL